jgi:hypothetical protein
MDINTTFEEYMTEVTKETGGEIYGIWGERDCENFYVLNKNFELLNEVKAFENSNYSNEVMSLVNGNIPKKILVICESIEEVKQHFNLDYTLFIKARKIEAHRNLNNK